MTQLLVLASQARTLAQLDELYYEGPEPTIDGITCGLCSKHAREFGHPAVKHASVEHVRYCFALLAELEAEHAGEIAAEAAATRYFENGCRTDNQVWEDNERERYFEERDSYFYRSY